ncbi:hypothetical protein [Streptosporangium sp. NPDC002721]|uniref:hypothetical protein n=1 Tax=Streptosporangium sp. NPDC002721 TaxID=3366188 RepID=UPI003673B1E0
MITKFFRLGDGTLISRSLQVEGSYAMTLRVPTDAQEISAEQAEEIRAGHAAQVKAWVAEQNAQINEVRRADYDALLTLGAPEATARRLTGYRGPADRPT